ncbi:MAG: TonB-dependent receptor, partial [Pseudomonadota bacterium]
GVVWDVPANVWGGDLQINGSAEYRDAYNLFNVANTGFAAGTSAFFPGGGPALDPEEYTLYNLAATWTSGDDKWKVGLYGRNLGDEEYRVAAYNFVTPSQLGVDSAYSAFYGAPRTFTVSLEYRY